MAQLNPYIKFNGNCREAFDFYKSCLGGELTVQTVGESPMAAGMSADMHHRVLHASLTSGGITLLGSDMMGADAPVQGNTVYLCLVCSSSEEVRTFFTKLGEGGQVTHALQEEFFGTFGDLTDKYGFNWMFEFHPTPA